MSIQSTLSDIQKNLHAPKNQRNTFGNYNYRSCEDILEALKKIMPEGCFVTLSDEVVAIGDRIYVKATASLIDGKDHISVCGYAREQVEKKGMDQSQITGAASSYARKYALNGLFLIDDNKDADSMDNRDQPKSNAGSEVMRVMSAGNDTATAAYWRSLDQEAQQHQWNVMDKESQKKLKQILAEIKS